MFPCSISASIGCFFFILASVLRHKIKIKYLTLAIENTNDVSDTCATLSDLAVISYPPGWLPCYSKKLKQPVVLGYIVAEYLPGLPSSKYRQLQMRESIRIRADIGVIFLLIRFGARISVSRS